MKGEQVNERRVEVGEVKRLEGVGESERKKRAAERTWRKEKGCER